MTERLIIRNFAGLNIDIELGRINIFIGPQASGKSVCIKSASFFQQFPIMLVSSIMQENATRQEFEESVLNLFSTAFTISEEQANFNFQYFINKEFIEIRYAKQKLRLTYSKFYHELFSILSKEHEYPTSSFLSQASSYEEFARPALERLENHLLPFTWGNHLFIPSNRAHFSLLSQTGRAPLSIISDDITASWFQGFYHSLKKRQDRRQYKEFPFRNTPKLASHLIERILRAKLTRENKKDVLIHQNGSKTSIRQGSSGQQETLPLLLVLEHLIGVSSPKVSSVLYIEEPETHLHPEAQRDLVDLLAVIYNTSSQPIQFFFTTHTPYLLSAFNNLIYAGQLSDKFKKNNSIGRKTLYATIPKELHLHLADFRVYSLEDGKAHLLIDEETGLLRADTIDSVSNVIGDQFTALMDLDPTTKPTAQD